MIRRAIDLAALILAFAVFLGSETRLGEHDTTIQISDVFGLLQALNVRPVMGTSFNINAVAVIDPEAALDAARGNPSDCIHVDGSSNPCGTSTQASFSFADAETPMGIQNGTNASFTLVNTPNPANSLHVFRNGSRLSVSGDYLLSGSVITFIGTQIPNPGDALVADYRY